MDNSGGKMMAIVLVILLMGGSVALFFMMSVLQEMNPDVHDHTHEYTVIGVLDGEECTGTGVSKYTPENSTTYVYEVTLEFGPSNSEKITFPLIFTKDEKMESSLYNYIGEETIGEKTVSVYERSEKGIDYTYYIGEHCTMICAHVVSDHYDVTADIVESA